MHNGFGIVSSNGISRSHLFCLEADSPCITYSCAGVWCDYRLGNASTLLFFLVLPSKCTTFVLLLKHTLAVKFDAGHRKIILGVSSWRQDSLYSRFPGSAYYFPRYIFERIMRVSPIESGGKVIFAEYTSTIDKIKDIYLTTLTSFSPEIRRNSGRSEYQYRPLETQSLKTTSFCSFRGLLCRVSKSKTKMSTKADMSKVSWSCAVRYFGVVPSSKRASTSFPRRHLSASVTLQVVPTLPYSKKRKLGPRQRDLCC